MNQSFANVLEAALALPEADQFQLVDALVAKLGPQAVDPFDEAWRAEIRRRCEEIDAGRMQLTPWEVVRDRVRRKHQANG